MFKNIDPTIFDSLNARQLTPRQVAESFITPESFTTLIERNNNVIIGPRGSGKTTLLKMLQLPALIHWNTNNSIKVIEKIDYISAFIPTDRAWEKQWLLIKKLKIDDNEQSQLIKAVYLTHTIRQTLEAFQYCRLEEVKEHDILSKFFINLTKTQEADIAKRLERYLKLSLDVPSVDNLMFHLRLRLSELGEFVHKNVRKNQVLVDKSLDYIYMNFIQTLVDIIDILNSVLPDKDRKWAFLFDELEIAPKEIRIDLFDLLRSSSDHRLLFKLSISPFSEDLDFSKITGSHEGHDFKTINLIYSRKDSAQQFCENFFKQMCLSYGLDDVSDYDVFGLSEFDRGNEKKGQSAYSPGSVLYNRFKSLEKKDSSFQDYLIDKQIDLENLDKMKESDRAYKVRKITNIVCVRNYFLGDKRKILNKKKATLYAGVKTIFDVTEGNPRLFISLIGPLLKQYVKDRQTISTKVQADALDAAINRFRSLLSSIPSFEENGKQYSVLDALDRIGSFFEQKHLKDEFIPEPPTGFIVDNSVSVEMKKTIGRAVNVGALIYVPAKNKSPLLDSLEGKRFRLSYLLAPYYRLPLLLNKDIDLSKIVPQKPIRSDELGSKGKNKKVQNDIKIQKGQGVLFDINEI